MLACRVTSLCLGRAKEMQIDLHVTALHYTGWPLSVGFPHFSSEEHFPSLELEVAPKSQKLVRGSDLIRKCQP